MEPPIERVEFAADDSLRDTWVQTGMETERLLQKVAPDSRTSVLVESTTILSDCLSPAGAPDRRVGLVIGYIQSGKTLSFTTVAALASDNNFPLIIVLAGTSVMLQEQSTRRLCCDLSVNRSGTPKWSVFKSRALSGNSERDSLRIALQRAIDSRRRGDEIRTVLITVMKERTHLSKIIGFLRSSGLPLEELPALIIDDEADQAGLNNAVKRNDRSRIYSMLVGLRAAVPHHTYLQYTATPQAPLLISLADTLSPSFVHVLTPGQAYTGGTTFFGTRIMDLVTDIPQADILDDNNLPEAPPESLLEAMRFYFLGVANHMIEPSSDAKPRNRSMMVHPSRSRAVHQRFWEWVGSVKDWWQNLIAQSEDNPDRRALIEEFRSTYDRLSSTAPEIATFEDLVGRLHDAMRDTLPTEVNTRQQQRAIEDHEQFWNNNEYHILVGGTQLDRGFTVEGLTVTYMPRSLGVGNADTIQQRARWFGYKDGYLGFCRVFLPHDSVDAFRNYVEHEEELRSSLRDFRGSLQQWRRRFFLDPALQPTRSAVLQYGFTRGAYGRGNWFNQQQPHIDEEIAQRNLTLAESFLARLAPRYDSSTRHLVDDSVALSTLYDELLTSFAMAGIDDQARYLGLLLQLDAYLRAHAEERCTVYVMSGTAAGDWGERMRKKRESDTIQTQQGFSGNYPGDIQLHSDDAITVQLHKIRVHTRDDTPEGVAPALSIWLPPRVSKWWIVQDQRQPQ